MKIPCFGDLDQTSPKCKMCSRNVLGMVGTSFESLEAVVSVKIIFVKFSNFFVPFCNQNGIIHIGKIQKPIIPFWLQKGTNITKIDF